MNKPHFHLHLKGFNYTAGIVAFAVLKSGLKVAIEPPASFNNIYQFEILSSYPAVYYNLANALRQHQFMMKCSSFYPHLFYPLRVLNLSENIPIKLYTIFDKLVGRDRESNFLPVSLKNTQHYRQLNEPFPRGALIYGHRFDRNQAIVDLYRFCIDAGAVKITANQNIESDCKYACEPFKREKYIIESKQTWPYPNAIQIERNNFSLSVYTGAENNICIQITPNKGVEIESVILDDIKLLLKKMQIEISDEIKNGFKSLLNSTQENETFPHIISDVPFHNLQKSVNRLLKEVEKNTGERVKLKHAFACFMHSEMSHEMFRGIDDECNAKYDLAKQTGIDYATFSRLFYRYRNQIDPMTEIAYTLLNTTRDVEEIWLEAERLVFDQQ